MKYRSVIASILIVILFLFAPEARSSGEKASALVRTRLSRDLTLSDLAGMNVDILAVYPDGRVDLAVTDEQYEWISSRSLDAAILERASLRGAADLDENLGLYHTYAEMEDVIDSLASEFPLLTRIDTLGVSIEGRIIRALKISDSADIDEEEPEVLLMGCHHARELMSVEIPLMMAQYLLDRYGSSPRVTSLVDEREIWIAPMINPDGHVYVQNNHAGDWWTWWRKNRRDNGDGTFGVDLNRNYGYMWGYDNVGSSPDPGAWTYRGSAPFSEPETQAVRDFCDSREFSAALSYHSYGELIIYPWGYDAVYTDDHELFAVLADSLKRDNDYFPGCTATDVLYPANGGTDDWAYGDVSMRGSILCYTIEVNSYEDGGFGPPDAFIQPTFDMMLQMNLTIISRAGEPEGVLGPQVPTMYEVADLADPAHMIAWSAGEVSDPNPPLYYELTEYMNLAGVPDTCEAGDTLWAADGFTLSGARAAQGSYSFYSGSGDDLHQLLSMETFYPLSFGDTLSCALWYDIESGWDYAYLEVSLDGGLRWQTVPGDVTTDDDPNGSNRGNGITGSSFGWVPAEFYVGDAEGVLPGSVVQLRFAYITDASVMGEGIYIDMVEPVASYEDMSVLDPSCPDTFYVREAGAVGQYAYIVRAADSEGHWSRRSNVVFHTVADITDAGDAPPLRTRLEGNYPNPFNPATTIKFTVGETGSGSPGNVHVRLTLYDVSGRIVASLVDRPLSPGRYSVVWEGTNSAGRRAASGIYFIRLVAGNTVLTEKAVLLR